MAGRVSLNLIIDGVCHPMKSIPPRERRVERAAIRLAARQRVKRYGHAWMFCVPICRRRLKKELARKVLDLSRGKDQKPPRIKISPRSDKHYLGEHAVDQSPLPHAAVFKSDRKNSMSFSSK